MREKYMFHSVSWMVLVFIVVFSRSALNAQSASTPAPPSIQEQLEAQYPLAKMTAQGGCTVTNPETGLALQKAGPAALPQRGSTTMCASHYRNGNFTKPGFRCTSFLNMTKQNLVTLEKGDKVFPTKIEVEKDEVKLSFGYCSGDPGQATIYTGQVVVEFPKDTLKMATVTQIEDKIAEVFSADSGEQQAQSGQPPQDGNAQGPAQPAPENQETPADAPSIEAGQTIDQVVAIMGQPQKKVNLGAKQIYIYKDLKVTFVGGKVADVQ
ncbi:MAG TPA: hypothetical protein VFB79_21705 [Candidatus Angelobacter sp.]|nr:hypothetical protein [Candidatus Angelobacter sp.]